MTTRAILFDLGNTLVGYYTSTESPLVRRRCLRVCARALGQSQDPARDEDLFERALVLNREQSDYAVRPLAAAFRNLFGAYESLDEVSARALGAAFLKPIFATARLDPQAVPLWNRCAAAASRPPSCQTRPGAVQPARGARGPDSPRAARQGR